MQVTLVISAMLSLVSGVIFGYVGVRLGRRDFSTASWEGAWKMFMTWWYCLALGALATGLLNLAAAFGVTSLPFFVGMTYFNLLLICVALWGLVYYLLYLFTGSSRTLPFLTVFYIASFLLLFYYVISREPIGVNVESWNVTLIYRQALTRPVVALLILLMLYFPQILCSAMYFGLYFRLTDPTQKYRVLLVSWSIMLWFLASLSATVAGLTVLDWWQLVSRVIGIIAAVAIFVAYFPPDYFQERFGVEAIKESGG